MNKISGFEKAEPIIGGGVYVLPTGNYKMKVIKAEATKSKTGKDMLKIAFDVADGQYKDFYKKKFENDCKRQPDKAKWSYDAIHYQMADNESIGRFKGFIKCLEDSNPNFSWDWDEGKLKGLVFAAQTHNEPTEYNGKTYDHNKIVNIYPVSDLENLSVLSDKELKKKPTDFGFGGTIADSEDIPF